MKMNTKYRIGISFLLLCICLCGCSKNDEIEINNDSFSFLISPPLSLEVIDTKADPIKLGDITISDVWILQFSDGSDKGILKGINITGNKISKIEGKQDLLIQLNTEEAGFSEIKSNFYIIVNGGSSLFTLEEVNTIGSGTLTEAVMKSKTIAFTFPENGGLLTTQPTLLTSGPIEYTPGTDKKIVVVSRMFRAFSKVSVTVNFKGKGVLNSPKISIGNIPTKMALFEAEGKETSYYPVSDSDIDASERSFSGFSWTSNTTGEMIFFMPENLRGSGIGKNQQDKGVEINGPLVEGKRTLDNCTYLTVEGDYKYDASHSGSIKVKYRFYLGGNFIDDYNIYRDYWYKLTINITGANSADLRVTITDGNVAVFDDVQTITNTVDF